MFAYKNATSTKKKLERFDSSTKVEGLLRTFLSMIRG